MAFVPVAYGASLTTVSDTLSTLKTGVAANHTINFTLTGGDAITNGETITLTFPGSSFTMGGSLTGVTIADNGGADNAVTSALWSAPTLTITASGTSTVAANHTATIKIPSAQITNPAVGTYVVSIGGNFGGTGSFAVAIIADDQIPVSGSVNPTLTFTVANTTLDLATMDSGAVATSVYNTITIGTNGSKGYTITVKDLNAGLLNSAASKTITSATATLSGGTEGYGGNCNKVSGSGSCTFVDGATNNVTAFTTAGSTFASYNAKPSATENYQIRVKAAIATTTEAGSYTDTLTVIGTANF